METFRFLLSINTIDNVKDLQKLIFFYFCELKKSMKYPVTKIEKVIGKFKTETIKKVWIDEILSLGCKLYIFWMQW